MAKTIKYSKVRKLTERDFKRVVGVKRETFEDMIKVVRKHYRDNKFKGGTTKSLSANDETLMMLEYYREYRPFKHIGVDYGVSESTAHYIVTKIEKILIKEPQFHLKTLKYSAPTNNANSIDIVIVDVTESECERPKKSKKDTTLEKRKDIHKKHK
jgi:hypothetical protein